MLLSGLTTIGYRISCWPSAFHVYPESTIRFCTNVAVGQALNKLICKNAEHSTIIHVWQRDESRLPAGNQPDSIQRHVNEPQQIDEYQEPVWDPDPAACKRRLQAVLFLARQPLSSRKISQLAGLEDGTQARTMIAELNKSFDEFGRAYQIKRLASGYQMMTRPQFSKWLRQLEHIPRARKLSRPAMETLAVVAYRQPVIKADIEAIRGVASGEMLRQLLEIGMVRIFGRSEELGRPFLYATTSDFLRDFGLRNQDDLPLSAELAGQGLPNWNNSDPISDHQNLEQETRSGSSDPTSDQDA